MAWDNFEDSNRLYGGNRNNGGLANVNYNSADNRNDNIAARPLVVSRERQKPLAGLLLQSLEPTTTHFPHFNQTAF